MNLHSPLFYKVIISLLQGSEYKLGNLKWPEHSKESIEIFLWEIHTGAGVNSNKLALLNDTRHSKWENAVNYLKAVFLFHINLILIFLSKSLFSVCLIRKTCISTYVFVYLFIVYKQGACINTGCLRAPVHPL